MQRRVGCGSEWAGSDHQISKPVNDQQGICRVGRTLDGMCDHLTAKYFHTGGSYCALLYPGEDKEDDFGQALEAQLREEHAIDHRNVWLPSDYCS